MKKQPDSTTTKTQQPEIDTSSLQDIFDKETHINEIDDTISSIDQQIVEKNIELAREAISIWDLSKAKEISETLKQTLPKGNKKNKEAYNQIQQDIHTKLVDEEIQKATDLYEQGNFSQAEKIFRNIWRPRWSKQEETINTYQALLQHKQKEIEIQKEEEKKQQLIQSRKDFPALLTTHTTEEINEQIHNFQKILNTIKDKTFVDQFDDFPTKEIYEALQNVYLEKDMDSFYRIIDINNLLCIKINKFIKTDRSGIPKKKIEKVLGIVRPLLGIWKIKKLPINKNYITIYKADTFIDLIRENCGFPSERKNKRQRVPSNDGKYINMANDNISSTKNIDCFIHRTWVNTSHISISKTKGIWMETLKKYLEGKYITSRTDHNWYRWLEVVS